MILLNCTTQSSQFKFARARKMKWYSRQSFRGLREVAVMQFFLTVILMLKSQKRNVKNFLYIFFKKYFESLQHIFVYS